MSRLAGGRWALAGFVVALTLIAAGLLRARAPEAGPARPDHARVVMIGVRGLSWGTAADLLARGKMPALSRIAHGDAAVGDIVAEGYGSEGEILASIVTGRLPFKHGVHGFDQARLFRDRAGPERMTMWEWMVRRGQRVGVIGFPFDPALARDRAVVVAAPGPAEVSDGLVARIVGDAALSKLIRGGLRRCLAIDLAAAASAEQLLRSDPDRHVFVYLQGLHRWSNDFDPPGELLYGYYEVLDAIVGDLVGADDGNSTYVLFSERGNPDGEITWRSRFPRLKPWPPIGFFLFWGRDVRRATRAHSVTPPDLAATLLYLSDNPLPADMDGAVMFGMIDDGVYARRRPTFSP